jgi:hypothetical protein
MVRRIRPIEKFNDFIGSGTRDLPACSIVLQPTTLPRAPLEQLHLLIYKLVLKFHQI